jgi:photosystem II stability/assembly factor-like uncharacterized protein
VPDPVTLLIGTRKGAFVYRGDKTRQAWQLDGPHFLGNIVNHLVADPRNRRTWLIAAKTGHLGPTVFRSTDGARTWTEAKQPPAFAKAPAGEEGQVVDSVFWLSPAHAVQPGLWYAGTSPPGLFRSTDDGVTWAEVTGFNEGLFRQIKAAIFPGPDGAQVHSICVDPGDPRHLYLGISIGGVFESTDGAQSWRPLNKGVAADFLPDPNLEYGHDPHTLAMHPLKPQRLYQQNHCGIYRLDRPDTQWQRIGLNMPSEVGDIGFPIVLHPRDADCAWVFPMDGTQVWPRTSPEGRPAVFVTQDAGASWQRLDSGMPKQHAWWTVKRQAMCADAHDPVGLYFGTTSGEIWSSRDEGRNWSRIAEHLPHIYSVTAA